MSQDYNNFRIINYNQASGDVEVAWYDDTQPGPIENQRLGLLNHQMPIELETETWTKGQLLTFLLPERPQGIPDFPSWLTDEAEHTRVDFHPVGKIIT